MRYKAGYKYQLCAPETFYTDVKPSCDIETGFIRLTKLGVLALFTGYAWDGATGAIDTYTNMAASAAHDAFCQLIQCGLLSPKWKAQSDEEYYKICRKYGMLLPRAIAHFTVISYHDWSTTPDKPIIEILPRAHRAGKGA